MVEKISIFHPENSVQQKIYFMKNNYRSCRANQEKHISIIFPRIKKNCPISSNSPNAFYHPDFLQRRHRKNFHFLELIFPPLSPSNHAESHFFANLQNKATLARKWIFPLIVAVTAKNLVNRPFFRSCCRTADTLIRLPLFSEPRRCSSETLKLCIIARDKPRENVGKNSAVSRRLKWNMRPVVTHSREYRHLHNILCIQSECLEGNAKDPKKHKGISRTENNRACDVY